MFLLRAAGVFLSTLFFGTISLMLSFFDGTGHRQNHIARVWARSLLRIAGVTVTIEGLDRITPDGVYVVTPNHLSYFDTPVLLGALPLQFRFMAKRGLFFIPLLGTHLKRAGHIPVDLDDPRAGVRTMNTAAKMIRENKISILVFPEGGRAPDGHLQEFKDGAASIGIRAGATIVPAVLCGTSEVLAFGSGRIQSAHVTLKIGEPIDTSQMSMKDRHAVTARIREQIVQMLGDRI
jgi:1-acyl-sn-glycerol-3-phosphate acyltransferase